jgi:hypothetical protein
MRKAGKGRPHKLSSNEGIGEKMKRFIAIVGFVFLLSGLTSASDIIVELRAHYFNPSEQAFKDIYGGGMAFGGEVSAGEMGYVAKLGSYINTPGRILFDLFIHYSYCELNPADIEINIGGIEAGIGVGYRF